MKLLVLLASLLLSVPTYAADFTFKYGISAPKELRASSKVFAINGVTRLNRYFIFQGEVGAINTPSLNPVLAGLGSTSFGIQPEIGPLFFRGVWGPCVYTRKDDVLGGHFQFNHDLSVGITDGLTSVQLGYKHISSAGLSEPNKGHDFFWLGLGVRL